MSSKNEVQNILFTLLSKGETPTTRELQQAYFGVDYNSDSVSQIGLIRTSITHGRELAYKQISDAVDDPNHQSEVIDIAHYEQAECMAVEGTEGWNNFHDNLIDGKLGPEARKHRRELLEVIPAYSLWFSRKLWELAKSGACMIIPIDIRRGWGKQAKWHLPSWFAWNDRELDQYRRSIDRIRTQFNRGIKTRVALPSGDTMQKALAYTSPIQAAIEDGTSWFCARCSARNLGVDTACSICNTTKPI